MTFFGTGVYVGGGAGLLWGGLTCGARPPASFLCKTFGVGWGLYAAGGAGVARACAAGGGRCGVAAFGCRHFGVAWGR